MNPFQVPGAGVNSGQPLCPWKVPEHIDYYAPVDHTLKAFKEDFTAAAERESLTSRGRLVVVHGQRGCGKTSLIHRCADFMRRELPHGSSDVTRVEVIDLTTRHFKDETVAERCAEVAVAIIAEISLSWQEPTTALPPEASGSSAALFAAYRAISVQLGQRREAILILLPPTPYDLAAELREYAEVVQPRIMIFAECPDVESAERGLAALDPPVRDEIIMLQVGPLDGGDGWTFVLNRLDQFERLKGARPEHLDQRTLQKLVAQINDLTVKALNSMLVGVWDDLERRGDMPRIIPLEDILFFYVNQAYRYRR